MATRTWSWEYDDLNNNINAGNSWFSYSLSADSTVLPSSAIVSKVEYRILMRIGNITEKSENVFRLYGVGIDDGPYTGASYNSSSPSAVYGTVPAATSVKTSNTETRPSSGNYKSGSFQNGNYYVWNYNGKRTYCEITGCDFVNIDDVSAFNNSFIDMRIKMNTNFGGTSYVMQASVTVTYETASLTSPGTPTIEQDETTGLYSVSWTSATGTNGSGDIEYRLVTSFDEFYVGTSTEWEDAIPPSYGEQEWFQVSATYSGITTYSGYAYMTFEAPTLTAPTLSISSDSGSSAILSWYKPTVSYGELDNCDYFILYSTGSSTGVEYISFTGSTDEYLASNVTESWLSSTVGEGNSVAFQLITIAYLNNTTSDYESIVDIGSDVFFTYDGANTIGYYTGTNWQPCTIHYYTGTEWKECIPYYYNGTQWVELKI